MKLAKIFLFIFMVGSCTTSHKPFNVQLIKINTDSLRFFPYTYNDKPDLPSPSLTKNGREILLAKTTSGDYCIFDVSQENSGIRNVVAGQREKGNQLHYGADAFKNLQKTGLHKRSELRKTLSINGRSVAEITVDAWPGHASWAGFLCTDETILSCIEHDNDLVKAMKLSHQQLARPLFHVWNMVWEYSKVPNHRSSRKADISGFYYNDQFLEVNFQGGRGWQTSLFNDSLTGTSQIHIFLPMPLYKSRNQAQTPEIFFSDLAPYYVQRYGFYEGHTSYRMDPRLIALTFGLITIDELIEKDILPDDESFKACPDAYIPQDSLWEQFRIAHSLLKNDPDSLSAKIKKIYAQSVGQLRRLCLNDILSDFEGDPIGLLLNEISIAHWEADTLASNHLISLGNRSIQGLRDIFLNTAHDSLVRWRALSVIGKINPMATKELMQFAEKDPSWIIRKEAAFISLAR